ncbi:glycosyltransferase family 2 protein [Sphingobacterium bovistauri]|uniref:Glycosyltransferase family 2 protein n=1 Tax=Sphingobacterium bovistauri TaxID=2781959 RepID=A0ABS7Z8J2_9SPHI|nr:glycosyltransferase family A protein [Sphingobacterium bovistauri]MCA5006518.1 glycosyltransferase family 2 protein [Sphingobacterium bovistauri]
MNSLVTVVIPFYNSEEYLAQTIDWVLESDYPLIEIILVDDGSKDKSLEIANSYLTKHNNIRVLEQKNQGVAVARNYAIQEASGKYIMPVDSDDMICYNYISEAVKILDERPEVKVVTSKGVFFGDKTGPRDLPDFNINLLARQNILHISALYRKSDWQLAGGYCPEFKGREDWDFWISMLKNGGEVYKLPIVGYQYRIRANSKRVRTRNLKPEINLLLNKRHKEFYNKVLNGPLRIQRTWSKPYNTLLKFLGFLK